MRHAKSSWKTDASTDHERPLNKRGRRDSPKVAAKLVELGWVPDYVLSSDSARTRETFKLMKEELDYSDAVDFRRELYHAGYQELRDAVRGLDAGVETVLVLGHNPGWDEALERLTGEEDELKTACAALLHRHADGWRDAMGGRGQWQQWMMIRPREL